MTTITIPDWVLWAGITLLAVKMIMDYSVHHLKSATVHKIIEHDKARGMK